MRFSRRYTRIVVAVAASLGIGLSSCQRYVQDVAKPLDLINDSDLNNEAQVPVLLTSLGGYLGYFMRYATLYSSTLSDECIITEGISSNMVSAEFRRFDNGEPVPDNLNTIWGNLSGTRFQAQNLLERIPSIPFTRDSTRLRCQYLGWFFLGLVDHYQALWFGLKARQGGGVIAGGPFLPTSQLHDSSLVKFSTALQSARTDYERRVVNSFIARAHLLEGRFPQALAAATNGMKQGDTAFSLLYAASAFNVWMDVAGKNNHQVIPDPRFRRYIEADPAEAGRVLLTQGEKSSTNRTMPYYIQAKYLSEDAPIELMTWQENALMLAECYVRASNAAAALAEVNRVRAAVPPVQTPQGMMRLAARTTTNLDSIYIERDKQLFATGMRLVDQRRWNRWHFAPAVAATAWYYLPIAQNERNTNPNLFGN
jgi:hypothetical protein